MRNFLFVLGSAAITLMAASCSKSSDNSDETTGNWIKRGDFNGAFRTRAVSFVIADTSAYIGTGYNPSQSAGLQRLTDFWRYNAATDDWVQVASLPGIGRSGAVGFSIGTKGYTGGGLTESGDYIKDFYEYTPATNSWVSIPDFPDAGGRSDAVAFSIGTVGYVGTGINRNGEYRDFYQYTPGGGWTQIESVPGSKRSRAVSFVHASKAYVVTGISSRANVSDFNSFDPSTGHWTDNNSTVHTRSIANLSSDSYDDDYSDIQRSYAAAFVIGNYAYLSTGQSSADGAILNKTWRYDFSNDTWSRRSPFEANQTSRYGAVSYTISGRGFIATGQNGASSALYSISEFRPDQDLNTND